MKTHLKRKLCNKHSSKMLYFRSEYREHSDLLCFALHELKVRLSSETVKIRGLSLFRLQSR